MERRRYLLLAREFYWKPECLWRETLSFPKPQSSLGLTYTLMCTSTHAHTRTRTHTHFHLSVLGLSFRNTCEICKTREKKKEIPKQRRRGTSAAKTIQGHSLDHVGRSRWADEAHDGIYHLRQATDREMGFPLLCWWKTAQANGDL